MDAELGEFVRIADVAKEQGVPASSVIRRAKRRGIAVWAAPGDHRVRLVTRADADVLRRPVLLFNGQQDATTAA